MKRLTVHLKQHVDRYLALALVVAGLTLYTNTLGNQLFWDDNDFIVNNQFVKDWHYLPEYFSENVIAGAGLGSNYWRPALLAVFSIAWHLWGSWAPGYHLVSTLLHTVNGLLLFLILLYLFKHRWLAFLTSLVFIVHPLQTEAVAYANSLGDSLSVLFMLGGLLLYLTVRQSHLSWWRSHAWWIALAAYALALMSKETAIIMPLLVALADFFDSQLQHQPAQRRLVKIVKTIWPFVLLGAAYVLLRATVLNFGGTFNLYQEQNLFTAHLAVRLFTFWRILTVYLGLLFWPLGLHMERSVPLATSLASADVLAGASLCLGLLVLVWKSWRRQPALSFGLLWFFVGLAPTSNLLVPINGLLYEHWLYLPLVGVWLAVVWCGSKLTERFGWRRLLLGVFTLVLTFFAVLTIRQNARWHDPVSFYTYTLNFAPTSYRLVNNLGMAYADRGDYSRAEELYRRAVALNPKNPVAYHNLGNAERSRGQLERAAQHYEAALHLDPQFLFSYRALASLYLEQQDYARTRQVLERSLGYTSSKVDTLLLLAQVAAQAKDYGGALGYLDRAGGLAPDNPQLQAYLEQLRGYLRAQE